MEKRDVVRKRKREWQDTEEVLGMFWEQVGAARREYKSFVGVAQGRRTDLSGGGLIRSAGGWESVRELKKERIFQKSDERILGDGDFVEDLLQSAEESMEKRYALRARGLDPEKIASRVAQVMGMKEEDVWAKGRYPKIVEARSLLCYWAIRELGQTMSSLAIQRTTSSGSNGKSKVVEGKPSRSLLVFRLRTLNCRSLPKC